MQGPRAGSIISASLRRGTRVEAITIGSRYQQRLGDGTAETAVVAKLFFDAFGIPHVGFELTFDRPGALQCRFDRRSLGLKAFCARYVEPVLGWRGETFGVVPADGASPP